VQAVDFTLQAVHAHIAFGNRLSHSSQISLGFGQQIAVLLQTQTRGLFLSWNSVMR
jgi:hypothetical protein